MRSSIIKLISDLTPAAPNPTNHPVRWRMGILASAIAMLCLTVSPEAQALSLGRITVQSALGEPLRAEIDIAEISAAEAGSLKVGIAAAEAFKAAGLEYTSAVSEVLVTLQYRPAGRSFLRLSSSRPVTEPFVDLVLDASWSSGRIARDYTMLFDPPSLRPSGNAGAAQVPNAPSTPRPVPSPAVAVNPQPVPPSSQPAPASPRMAAPAKVISQPRTPINGQRITIKTGDTAGKIAAQNKPSGISLDQMLVALLKSNPDAFIGGNVNRLKSGVVLTLPEADQAGAASPGDATRTIVAQAKDFNEFRRKFAENVPRTQVGPADRQAGGKLQAKIEDRAPATATPDKLTLSKGAVQGKAAAEDKIAKERQAKEAAIRVAELSKNIGDLNRLAGTPGPASPAASAAAGPGVTLGKPAIVPVPMAPTPTVVASSPAGSAVSSAPKTATPSVVGPVSPVASTVVTVPVVSAVPATTTAAVTAAASAASAPAPAASAPVPAASQAAVSAQVVPVVPIAPSPPRASAPAASVAKAPAAPISAEPSLFESLKDNPLALPALGGLLLLLAGLGVYRYRKGNTPTPVDSSFLESRLQPDSFFGASGGQRIDTNDGGATGSSLVYSPSQLDAAGDVDPVAEADVYLAYGRDLQAEEILKEALRTSPKRVAIHAKLTEIYAKRRDIRGFETIAVDAFSLTRGEGAEWAYITQMGRELDPVNPMYQPGGQPPAASRGSAKPAVAKSSTFSSSTLTQPIQPQSPPQPEPKLQPTGPSSAVDLDLNLDVSSDFAPVAAVIPPVNAPAPVKAPAPVPAPVAPAPVKSPEPAFADLDLDLYTQPAVEKASTPTAMRGDFPSLADQKARPDNSLNFEDAALPLVRPEPAMVKRVTDGGMLEFDLSSLSLDLPGSTAAGALASQPLPAAAADGPLETKFALAEEFRLLGDIDGARSLAEEVVAEAKGSLKSKAQSFLHALS